MHWNDGSVVDTGSGSDGRLGEGDPEVVVLPQVVVVELDEGFDGLLDRAHLDQSHLMVFLEELEGFDNSS